MGAEDWVEPACWADDFDNAGGAYGAAELFAKPALFDADEARDAVDGAPLPPHAASDSASAATMRNSAVRRCFLFTWLAPFSCLLPRRGVPAGDEEVTRAHGERFHALPLQDLPRFDRFGSGEARQVVGIVDEIDDGVVHADLEFSDAGIIAAKLPAPVEVHAQYVAEEDADNTTMRDP